MGSYLQHTTPNGLCVEKILECFGNYPITCDIICTEHQLFNSQPQNIYPVYYHLSKNKIFKIKKFFQIPINHKYIVRKLKEQVKELVRKNCYDAVIAVVNPPEAAEAVYKVKMEFSNINFILYEIDPASNRYKYPSNIIEKYSNYKSAKWEKRIYSVADSVIHMKTHREHFSNKKYKEFENKTIYLDIPSFYFTDGNKNTKKEGEKTNLIYAGAFYPILREPDYMIESLAKVYETNKNINLSIYTRTMKQRLQTLSSKYDFKFDINEPVTQEKIQLIFYENDILISIGNHQSDFLPSKVLSYISTCKPVIHFYSDPEDVSLHYFKKYENALLVDMNIQTDAAALKILRFIEESKNTYVDIKKLKANFIENSPEFTAKKIMEIL
jgi:hypothetical protein